MAYGVYTPPAQSTGGWSKARRYVAPKPRVTAHPPNRPAKPVPRPRRAIPPDPFAPMTDAQLRARAGTESQATLGPIIDSIRQAIEARSQSGMAGIAGLTNELGGLWKGVAPATAAIYNQAKASGSQINDALANRLGNFGQGLQTEIAGKAALQGAPTGVADAIAGGAAQTAQGAANAGFARGSAGLEMLNAQGAAAGGYGAALPGIAGLTGIQSGRQLQAQLNQSLTDQLSSAQTNAASNQSSIYQHLLDQELNKAVASQSGLINKEKLAADIYNKRQTRIDKRNKDRYDRQIKLKNLGISQQRVTEYARHNGISETQAATRLIQSGQTKAETHRHNVQQETNAQRRARIAQQNANTAAKNKKGGKTVPKGLGGK